MSQNDLLTFNIDHLKIIPEELEGFEEFCLMHERRIYGGFHFFKLFSKNGELDDFHDEPIYEYHESPDDNKSLYNHICRAFKEFNLVLDAIAKGEVSPFTNVYVNFNRTINNKKKWGSYQDYIDSDDSNIYGEAYKFFEKQAVGALLAEELYKRHPKELKKLKTSRIQNDFGYSNFDDDIAFVVEANQFNLFIPTNGSYPTINRAKKHHERLRMKLRLASFYQANYYYWLFLMSNTEGKTKEINDLKSQVNKQIMYKYLMAGRVDLSNINNELSLYYSKSEKSKNNNAKQELGKDNYGYIEDVMDNMIGLDDICIFKSSFDVNKSQFIENKKIKKLVNSKIENYNSLSNNDSEKKALIDNNRTFIRHLKKYFQNKQ